MPVSDALLPEFDHEMTMTRRTLERVPEAKFGWKPHEKSMSMGELAAHLANIPGWAAPTLNLPELDLPPDFKLQSPDKLAPVLEMFDKNVAEARAAIGGASDAALAEPWSLLVGGKKVFTMPRIAVLRSMVFNHNVHHRAQIGVYLRLNDVPVPAIYGPSADERNM